MSHWRHKPFKLDTKLTPLSLQMRQAENTLREIGKLFLVHYSVENIFAKS